MGQGSGVMKVQYAHCMYSGQHIFRPQKSTPVLGKSQNGNTGKRFKQVRWYGKAVQQLLALLLEHDACHAAHDSAACTTHAIT